MNLEELRGKIIKFIGNTEFNGKIYEVGGASNNGGLSGNFLNGNGTANNRHITVEEIKNMIKNGVIIEMIDK